MSLDQQLQDKFSDFEPEVPNEQVDAGWEHIKYFLPQQERKKRIFFLFRYPKTAWIAAAGLIGLIITLLWLPGPEKLARVGDKPRTRPFRQAAFSTNTERRPTSPRETLKADSTTATSAVAASIEASLKTDALGTGSAHTAGSTRSGKPSTGMLLPVAAANMATPGQVHQDTNTPGSSLIAPSEQPAEWMALRKEPMPEFQKTQEPDPQLAMLSTVLRDTLPNKALRPSLDFFCGLSERLYTLQSPTQRSGGQAFGFSAGVGAQVPLSPRVFLAGRFHVGYHPVSYRETNEHMVIAKRDVVNPVIITSTNTKDTLIRYETYRSGVELTSKASWHLAAGAGYRLFSSRRISLDGALLLDFRYMRVAYRVSRTFSDTGTFLNNSLTSPVAAASFYETVNSDGVAEPSSGKKTVLNIGVSPYLNLAYQLKPRTALFVRPTYLIQVSPNMLKVGGKTYKLNEQCWYVLLGLTYAF